MFRRLSLAGRVFVLALALVVLHRLELIFIVMGPEQIVAALGQGDGTTIGITVTGLLSLLAIPLALTGRTLGVLLGLLVLVINIVFSGPFLIADLADPHRFGTWLWSLTVLSANVLGLLYGVIALVEQFRRGLPQWAHKLQARVLRGSVAAVAGMVLFGAILMFAAAPTEGLAQTPDVVL